MLFNFKTELSACFQNYRGPKLFVHRCILAHKHSLASCQWYRHRAESRALTCPFKQSNLSASSLLSWHTTHKNFWGRLYLIQFVCSPLSRSRQVIQIVSTEALLLNASLERPAEKDLQVNATLVSFGPTLYMYFVFSIIGGTYVKACWNSHSILAHHLRRYIHSHWDGTYTAKSATIVDDPDSQ